MFKERIHTTDQALLYMTECTLATVDSMALTKSRKVGEYDRQKSIAQTAINWIKDFDIKAPRESIRVCKVLGVYNGDVQSYVSRFEVQKK